ncbi:hypothetical protein F5Y16DRAFT_38323 [Xylariaceae sp. FL0255]|nr:hypothetical protein F5Y16DRAFT_38323 [Xylariaceae sp. FL0255]
MPTIRLSHRVPAIRLPSRVPKPNLQFLKKLLPKRTQPHALSSLSEVIIDGKEQSGKEKSNSKVEEKEEVVPPEECPICHDPVGILNPEGILESWVQLHCGHKFGSHCIQTWLQESAERDHNSSPCCPLCRTIAKHPCGHPVATPLSSQFTIFLTRQPPMTTTSRRSSRARPRRRLSRRSGHPRARPPLQPAWPQRPNPQRLVQTVGNCNICKAAAEIEKSMILTPVARPELEIANTATPAAPAATSGSGTATGNTTTASTGSRRFPHGGMVRGTRKGIKSIILCFKRQAPHSILTARPGTRTILVGESGERYAGVVEAMQPEDNGYGTRNVCRVHIEGTIPRTPTPMQATLQASF